MANMNPRERVLFVLTIIALAIFAAWQFGLGDAVDNIGGGNASIAQQEREFKENLEALEGIYEIEKKYRRLGQSPLDAQSNKRPIDVFQEYVYQLARERGFPYPKNLRSDVEEIEEVEDYDLLTVYIQTEGTFANTVALLKDFEKAGLLLREVDLRGTRDRDEVVARVVVARIAKRPVREEATSDLFDE